MNRAGRYTFVKQTAADLFRERCSWLWASPGATSASDRRLRGDEGSRRGGLGKL